MNILLKVLFFVFIVLFSNSCNVHVPRQDLTHVPFNTFNRKMTFSDLQAAILRAGVERGWKMQVISHDHIVATYKKNTFSATVDIVYSLKNYSITYKNSTGLTEGGLIHRNYNNWLIKLSRTIDKEVIR